MTKKNKKFREEENIKTKVIIEQFIDKSDMDSTQFFSFIPDDFNLQLHHSLQLLRKISRDLNYMLYQNFKTFWATIQYNISFPNLIESFLLYFYKRKINLLTRDQLCLSPLQQNKYDQRIELVEFTAKIIFEIIYRMVFAKQENKKLSQFLKTSEILYKSYILDISKLFDFLYIYYQGNQALCCALIKQLFKNVTDYQEDMKKYMVIINQKIIKKMPLKINQITERDQFDNSFIKEDFFNKMKILALLSDTFNCLVFVFKCFPQHFQECLVRIFDAETQLVIQNIFYQLVKGQQKWSMGQFREQVILLMDSCLEIIREFLIDYLNYLIYHVSQRNRNEITKIIRKFGLIVSMSKRKKQKRTNILIEQLSDKINFDNLLQLVNDEDKEDEEIQNFGKRFECIWEKKINFIQRFSNKEKQQFLEMIEQQPLQTYPEKQEEKEMEKQEQQEQCEIAIQKNKMITEKQNLNSQLGRIREQLNLNKREYDDQFDDNWDLQRIDVQNIDSGQSSQEERERKKFKQFQNKAVTNKNIQQKKETNKKWESKKKRYKEQEKTEEINKKLAKKQNYELDQQILYKKSQIQIKQQEKPKEEQKNYQAKKKQKYKHNQKKKNKKETKFTYVQIKNENNQ